MAKTKGKNPLKDLIQTKPHQYFGNDAASSEAKLLYLKNKMSPEEYVNLLSGQYGDPYRMRDEISESPHNKEKLNERALNKLLLHKKTLEKLKSEGKSPADFGAADLDYPDLINEILKKHPLSKERISDVIENPHKYGDDHSDVISKLSGQRNLNKEHLKSMASEPGIKFDKDLIDRPQMDKEVAKELIKHPQKFDESHVKKMLETSKHNDPNRHFLDQSDIKNLLLNAKGKRPVKELLDAIGPDIDENGEKSHNTRDDLIDHLIGLKGGSHENEKDYYDDPKDFGWNNWSDGKGRDNSAAEKIASYEHLNPRQIEHIKRHGSPTEKYELFKNPNIDKSHAIEMYKKWLNDEHSNGYDLDDFKESIKKEHPLEDMYDDYHENARQQAEEDYPLSQHTQNWSDEDWVDPREHRENYLSENPEASDEDVAKDYKDAVADAKQNTPDSVYESYDNALHDDVSQAASDLYDKDMETAHGNYDFLPSHLKDQLPDVNEIERQKREQEEKEAREKAEAKETELKSYLDEKLPARSKEHSYGDLQHHAEMAKDYADANGGAIDIGSLNKLFPNLKDKWKPIFGNKGKLSSQEIEQKINELPKTKYDVSYGKWDKGLQNINERPQVVMRLDHSPESLAPLKENPELYDTFRKINDVSQRSGHPTNANTIGWARVDTTDPKHWMVDELQSDFGSAARDYLKENGKDEDADKVDQIIKYHKNWREALLNNVLKTAKANGVEKVSTHSPESKASHTGADKVHSVYKDSYQKIPRSMGFRPVEMDELPLNEEGKKSFLSSRSGTDVRGLIAMHKDAMQMHALLSDAHSDLSMKASEENKPLHDKHSEMHSDMYKKHRNRLEQLDPTDNFRKMKTVKQFVGNFYHDNASTAPAIQANSEKTAMENLGANKNTIPVFGYDSALKEQAQQAVGNPGHTYDLTPQVAKKNLVEVTDLMKVQEIDNDLKMKVAYTLESIKQNKEILGLLQQTNPDAYNSLTQLVQSMVDVFKAKTGEDPEQIMEQIKQQEAMEQQQAQMQQQDPNSQQAEPSQDEPIHGKRITYAPGAQRQYSNQSAKIKDADGNWHSFHGGLQDPQGGSNE